MKIPNNQDKIADEINSMGINGVEAVGDDGSVCIEIKGSKEQVWDAAKAIEAKIKFHAEIGDGVQSGVLWVNADEAGVHKEFADVLSMF